MKIDRFIVRMGKRELPGHNCECKGREGYRGLLRNGLDFGSIWRISALSASFHALQFMREKQYALHSHK
jgi:hypothetical protein